MPIRMIEMFKRNLNNRSNGPSLISGVTLVELMVTIVLIALGTTLALPSYTDMVEKRRLTSGVQQLAAFINQGQTEAVRRNQPITFSYSRSGHDEWCVGAVVGLDSCDCREDNVDESDYCAIDGARQVLGADDLGATELMHEIVGNGSFAFEPIRGILLESDDALAFGLHSDSRDYKINLVVNATGEVKNLLERRRSQRSGLRPVLGKLSVPAGKLNVHKEVK